eukprot:589445-Prymnesium_polylepis.1
MNADGPDRPEPTAPRPPKRGRNRTFASWDDCCKPGGPLDREDDEFDQFNGLGEYSADRCGCDGFYQAETHWTSRRTGVRQVCAERVYATVHTKSLRTQELEAQRQFLPGGTEYEAAASSYTAARVTASTLPAPHTAPLNPPPPPIAAASAPRAASPAESGRVLANGMQHWPCTGPYGACSVELLLRAAALAGHLSDTAAGDILAKAAAIGP